MTLQKFLPMPAYWEKNGRVSAPVYLQFLDYIFTLYRVAYSTRKTVSAILKAMLVIRSK